MTDVIAYLLESEFRIPFHVKSMISTHFDMWIFCDVSSFESEFASVCVEINVLHPDGQSGPDPIGSGRAGGRFVGHFTDRRGLKI